MTGYAHANDDDVLTAVQGSEVKIQLLLLSRLLPEIENVFLTLSLSNECQ